MSAHRRKPAQQHTHNDEENGKDAETHELDGLATPCIDDQEGSPISGNKAGNSENKIPGANVVQRLVDTERGTLGGSTATEFNGSQDDRAVEAETVESDLETS